MKHTNERESSPDATAAKEAKSMLAPKSLDFIRSVAARHGAERVLLFGSCLTLPEADAGDIDLAIEGLDSVAFHALWDDLMWAPELNKKRVDLVRVEDDLPAPGDRPRRRSVHL